MTMSFNISSDGSPTPRKGLARMALMEELKTDAAANVIGQVVRSFGHKQLPSAHRLTVNRSLTSNLQGQKRPLMPSQLINKPIFPQTNALDATKKTKIDVFEEPAVTDNPLPRLNGHSLPDDQLASSIGSIAFTQGTDDLNSTPPSEMSSSVLLVNASELQKLRLDLQEARNEVNRMTQEIHSQLVARSTMDQLGPSSEADYGYTGEITEQALAQLQNKFNASTRNSYGWGNEHTRASYDGTNNFSPAYPVQSLGPAQSSYRRNGFLNEPAHFPLDQNFRNAAAANGLGHRMNNSYMTEVNGCVRQPISRPSSVFDSYNQFAVPTMYSTEQMAPIGTMGPRLSPDAREFSGGNSMNPSPWNSQAPNDSGTPQYVSPAEPMNYRRLLDRNMSCNWKYIVEKIICNNDQQASIFLQQKLKVGTTEQKFDIVEAIISQAYALMVNRFGNFLVQRCFEHGTHDQIIAIAQAIRGNTLALSMDAFGCHVIQKAFDCVPEEYKATMVHELLRRIPETVIHRYACHVWQKLFELRWADSPPQIMRYVNEALRGMWHEVALGETGSLVVQNIFENCLEEDKRPCINEVLASIDIIAQGQFGNWCIQHICEHGAPADRSRAIDHILRFATDYSTDQYASKVIEKCLKISSGEFLDRYLERVCEASPDRPRMPLIDIAADQFGNYLVQYILTNSSAHHRDLVGSHIRKHMVSLRGSKYGSRVAMLCCNPALATRPGAPMGMVARYNNAGPRPGLVSYR